MQLKKNRMNSSSLNKNKPRDILLMELHSLKDSCRSLASVNGPICEWRPHPLHFKIIFVMYFWYYSTIQDSFFGS